VAQANVKLTVDGSQATRALEGVQNKTTKLNAGVNRLKTAIAGVGLTVLARQAIQTSANFEKLNVRLGLLTKASGTFARSQELATQAQRAFGLSATEALEGITDITARLQPLGVGVEDIKTTFFGFNTAAKLAGASAIESSNAFRQLAQALGSGRLQGDEFRSISEQIPTILKPVADELGTTVGELKKFSSEGKITSGVVIRALKKIETEGGASLAALLKNDPTQVFKNLSNETENLSRAFGDRLAPAILPVIKAITNLTRAATDFVNSGAGQVTLTVTAIAVALKGVSIITPVIIGQIATMAASFQVAAINSALASTGLKGLAASSFLASGAITKATIAVNAFKIALIKTGLGALIVVLGTLAAKFIDSKNAAKEAADAAKAFDDNIKGVTESAKESTLELLNQTLATKENALAELEASKAVGHAATARARNIKALKEEIKQAKINIGVEKRRQKLNKQDRFNELINNNLKEQFKLKELIKGKSEEEFNLNQQIRQIKEDFNEQDAAELIRQLKITNGLKNKVKLIKDAATAAKELKQKFADIGQEIEQNIKDELREAIKGAKSFGDAMNAVLNKIQDKLIDLAIDDLFSGINKKDKGGGIGGFISNVLGGLFADGGRPPVGKASIVGEKGPELFIPSTAGTIIPNNKLGGGDSITNIVNVSVDASGSSVEGDDATSQQLGQTIALVVQETLVKEKRNGGLLA
jgi:tape measure domain-containing protein